MNIQPVTSASFNIQDGWVLTAAYQSSVPPSDEIDYFGAFILPVLGSIAPTTFLGNTINVLGTTNLTGLTVYTTGFAVAGNLAQNAFISLTVNGMTLNSSAVSTYEIRIFPRTETVWIWENTRLLSAAGT